MNNRKIINELIGIFDTINNRLDEDPDLACIEENALAILVEILDIDTSNDQDYSVLNYIKEFLDDDESRDKNNPLDYTALVDFLMRYSKDESSTLN